jgi:hypothetical protein
MSGQGRPKGVPNKVSADMILGALDQARRRGSEHQRRLDPGAGDLSFVSCYPLSGPVSF